MHAMDHVSRILPKALRRRGLQGEAGASHVTYRAKLWLLEKRPDLQGELRPLRFKDGTLVIGCAHAVAAQECQALLPGLESHLRDECGCKDLRSIRLLRL